MPARPNVLFVFADQWRGCDLGCAGNPEVATPHLDALAKESVRFRTAVATMPVCSPWRACFLTGQYPLTHGLFLNDLRLSRRATSLGEAFARGGYETAWIWKWHVDGGGREAPIPPERRQGFSYWRTLECTHDYFHSAYFAGDETQRRLWPGYDAEAQTEEAIRFLDSRPAEKPFFLTLSWGPPHDPYHAAPGELLDLYEARALTLRPNVPEASRSEIRSLYAGYYAHIAALDRAMGRLLQGLEARGLQRETIVVFTSDHGDMLGSQGMLKKQKPWDESIRVPLLIRVPGNRPREIAAPVGTPDLMPTLLGLCGLPVPATVEGRDLSAAVRGRRRAGDEAALILCASPFGEWTRERGGREYRGIRTARHTYVRSLDGPWLLYDNDDDPYQQRNRVGDPACRALRDELEERLRARLHETGDDFASGPELIRRCGYRVDAHGTVNYLDPAQQGQTAVRARRESG